ncbi:phage holin family protein [Brevibacterium luteolum]|uniref:Phage holin family protein n=1 Tax=Brevibacterium luteolum TaxID=199591 RepID=A0A849APS7_9MICO|nr:phage holin family protein [Brevibacterium luteolum]MBM7528587.1 putative membrane protein [Brevibacterium luteolum]MCT1656661.1 phage holin family protein [Brevibacterium luteolum]MCT1828581.1 phage holin family protein [Brevibacterium luteolum]MCT1872304.1 phage holin family protein [Brevibacterium luteolum]MCT1889757.1 phage holin family protein [Brevibacterium luteolum]
MTFLLRVIVNAVAIWAAAALLPGMAITSADTVLTGLGPTASAVVSYLVIGLIFGLVNAIIRPLIELIALPITCLTLGLFTIVINAAMVSLTSWVSQFTPIRLEIDSFLWTAVLASIIIAIVSLVLNFFVRPRERETER